MPTKDTTPEVLDAIKAMTTKDRDTEKDARTIAALVEKAVA